MPSGKRVVFIGDCQAGALAHVYGQVVAPLSGDSIRLVIADQPKTGDAEAIAQADMVVAQMFSPDESGVLPDGRTMLIDASGTRSDAHKVEFPAIYMGFLWPFSGRDQHVRSPTAPFVYPPYDVQLGDTFLNQLITEGVPAEGALKRYLETDIVRVAKLDQMLERHLAQQAARDRSTGFAFAPMIEAGFRDRCLFLTSHHPTLPLFAPLLRGVFERMGVPPHLIDTAVLAQRVPPMPENAAPIHPAIIGHFGLRFVNENSVYRFHDEGSFTFPEFVLRYMRHTWNQDLARGRSLARSEPDIEKAHRLLERGLEVSPKSITGWRSMSEVLRRMRRMAEARSAATWAIALDPLDYESHVELARVLMEQNDFVGAAAAARRAVACFGGDGTAYLMLTEVLIAAGQTEKATEAARQAAACRPGDAYVYSLLGKLLVAGGDWDGAEDAFRRTVTLNPGWIEAKLLLAQVLREQHKDLEAISLAHEVLASGVKNPHVHALLGHIHERRDELDEAEAAFRAAVSLDPDFSGLHEALAKVMARSSGDGAGQSAEDAPRRDEPASDVTGTRDEEAAAATQVEVRVASLPAIAPGDAPETSGDAPPPPVLLAYCMTTSDVFTRRMQRTLEQQHYVDQIAGGRWAEAHKVLIIDAAPEKLPSDIQSAFEGRIVTVPPPYIWSYGRPRFCLSKFRNASIDYALQHGHEWMMLCDCDTVIYENAFRPPATKFGRPHVYWQKSAEEAVDQSIAAIQAGGKQAFSPGNSWFVLHRETMERLRFNETIYGYGWEDIDFDVRANAAGYWLEDTGAIVIHMFHPEAERAIEPAANARNEAIMAATRSLIRDGYDPGALPTVDVAFAIHPEWWSPLCFILGEQRLYIPKNDAWATYRFNADNNLVVEWENPDWPREEFCLQWEVQYKLVSRKARHPEDAIKADNLASAQAVEG